MTDTTRWAAYALTTILCANGSSVMLMGTWPQSDPCFAAPNDCYALPSSTGSVTFGRSPHVPIGPAPRSALNPRRYQPGSGGTIDNPSYGNDVTK